MVAKTVSLLMVTKTKDSKRQEDADEAKMMLTVETTSANTAKRLISVIQHCTHIQNKSIRQDLTESKELHLPLGEDVVDPAKM